MENSARKFRLQLNKENTKYMIVERKNSLKKNKIGHLKIKKLQNLKEWKILNIYELYLMKITITKYTCKK